MGEWGNRRWWWGVYGGRGKGPEDDLLPLPSTLLSLVPPLLFPLPPLPPLPLLLPLLALLLPHSLAAPLFNRWRSCYCRCWLPLHLCPPSRLLAPLFDCRYQRCHSRCCRCRTRLLPPCSIAATGAAAPAGAAITVAAARTYALSLAPRLCASALCSPCLLSVV